MGNHHVTTTTGHPAVTLERAAQAALDRAQVYRRSRDELADRVNDALVLHRPAPIYETCPHDHTTEDLEAGRCIEVDPVGYTCDDGYMYAICRGCCTDGDGEQTGVCADEHAGNCWPCPTARVLLGTAQAGR